VGRPEVFVALPGGPKGAVQAAENSGNGKSGAEFARNRANKGKLKQYPV